MVFYKYALDYIQQGKCYDIYKAYTIHEKKFGDRAEIESVTSSKKKLQYEEVPTYTF